jgi:hypothetical protein
MWMISLPIGVTFHRAAQCSTNFVAFQESVQKRQDGCGIESVVKDARMQWPLEQEEK